MQNYSQLTEKVKKFGVAKKENWLEKNDQKKIADIILKNKPEKGEKKSWLSLNFRSHLIKFLTFDYLNLSNSFYLLKLSKKLNLNEIANNILGAESKLCGIDFYYNNKSNNPVLDWHCDTAYSGSKNVETFLHPDNYAIKFFFYLTDVFIDNGCLSYIPGSNKITYVLKKGIYEKSINYSPYWSLTDYRKMIAKNYSFIKKHLSENFLKEVLDKIDMVLENPNKNNIFDNKIDKGGALIFDESGIHRGSKLLFSDRMALRFFYKKKLI